MPLAFFRLWNISACLLFILKTSCGQNWWNVEEHINPYKIPAFTPLPNQRFTHDPEINKFAPSPNDVIVDIPKPGLGIFIGSSVNIDYDYTWTQWPPIRGRLVNEFLGIPYAAPPVGSQRFRNPVPAYLDTRYPWFAKTLRPACLQADEFFKSVLNDTLPMSEDCLYLNLFYPNRTFEDPNIRYPVIVHIHGGSFVCGSNHLYPGHVLASKGVVFVSINYRLGPLGFLSTGDEASMGNYGLWDQLMAIRWVKENIEWFHGDPNRITLMGESAGAASVGLHTVSPASRSQDLFHQVIMMSGSDLSDWAVADPDHIRNRYYAIELGRELRCPAVQGKHIAAAQAAMRGKRWKPQTANEVPEGQFGNQSATPRLTVSYSARIDAPALMRCLRYERTAEEILRFSFPPPLNGASIFIWTPVVDGTSGFLPRAPLEERKQGRFQPLPILAGVTHDEGSMVLLSNLVRWEKKSYKITNFTDAVVRRTIGNLLNSMNVLRFQATAEELYTRYTWWPNLANNSARWENMVALISDYVINAPLDTVVRYHSSFGSKAYFYEFSYVSPKDTFRAPEKGVYHGAEQSFLLGFPFLNEEFWNRYLGSSKFTGYSKRTYSYPLDTNVSEFVMEAWTNFAKYGDPTPQPIKNVTWPPYKQPWEAYLFLSLNSTPKFHFRSQRMAFWRERFLKLAEPLAPSPPIYYFPLFDAQLATVVLGLLLFLIVTLLVVMVVLLNRRPHPKMFRHSVRLAPPGAAPGSVFQTAFDDAFTTHTSVAPPSNYPARTTGWPTRSATECASVDRQQLYGSLNPSSGSGAGSNSQLSMISTRRAHPPPPPLPPQATPYRTGIRKKRGSRDLIDSEHCSLESLPMCSHAVDI